MLSQEIEAIPLDARPYRGAFHQHLLIDISHISSSFREPVLTQHLSKWATELPNNSLLRKDHLPFLFTLSIPGTKPIMILIWPLLPSTHINNSQPLRFLFCFFALLLHKKLLQKEITLTSTFPVRWDDKTPSMYFIPSLFSKCVDLSSDTKYLLIKFL